MDVGPLAPTSRADDGASSSDHRPGPQGDVHALAGHPRVEGRPYDAGGGGGTRSRDGRFTWDAAGTGWDCPCDGPARAAVWRWSAEGPWGPLSAGLPDPQDSISYAAGSHVFAGIADGRIHRTPDRGDTRERLSAQADAVVAVDEGG